MTVTRRAPSNCNTQAVNHGNSQARRRLTALFVGLALVTSACITGERPTLTDDTLPSDSAPAVTIGEQAGVGESTEGSAPTDSLPLVEPDPSAPALALITPTGVIVPVLETTEENYVITTPCGGTSTLVWGTPIRQATVAIDPGHGGSEPGAVGPNGLTEKELNLDIARRTARLLEQQGITVVLTRTADYRVPLAVRAEIGNRLGSELMVSIHHNAPNGIDSDTPGTEVFVQSGSDESSRLGGLIQEEVVAALSQFEGVEWTTALGAGAIAVVNDSGEDAYGMIRRPEMPAVLAELGYLSNASEASLFLTDEYRDVSAQALATAIVRWLQTDDPGSGFDVDRTFNPSGGTGGSEGCVDPLLE